MSIKLMSLVWDHSAASAEAVPVLLAIADMTNDTDGYCYPSVALLARRTRRSERSVQRQIRALVELGELHIVQTAGRANHYRINEDVLDERRQAERAAKKTSTSPEPQTDCHPRQIVTPDAGVGGGVTPASGGGDTGDTLTIKNHQGTKKNAPDGADTSSIDDDFKIWWSRYPRKVGKDAARRAYRSARRRGVTATQLLDGLKRTSFADHKPGGPDYRPHPATWLNQGRWDDEPDTPELVYDYATGTYQPDRQTEPAGEWDWATCTFKTPKEPR